MKRTAVASVFGVRITQCAILCFQSLDLEKEAAAQAQEAGELKRLLEWELSQDASELSSHAWYHGTIPRARAEEVVLKDGSFLIRWVGTDTTLGSWVSPAVHVGYPHLPD